MIYPSTGNHETRAEIITHVNGGHAFANLLDLGFAIPSGMKFLDDFPIWDPLFLDARIRRFGLFAGSRLVAAVGIRLADLQYQSGGPLAATLPVAVVGAVVTHPEYRGRGFASRLVTQGLAWAETQGAICAMLWSSEHALYERLGFSRCGSQLQVPLGDLNLPASAPMGIGGGWRSDLFPLMQKRNQGLILKASDLKWMASHQNVQWLWCADSLGVPTAYIGLGRGIDLGGMIHEWGGEVSEVLGLCGYVHALNSEIKILASPAHMAVLSHKKTFGLPEYLGLAKILNLEALQKLTDISVDGVESLLGAPFPKNRSGIFKERPAAQNWWVWGLDAS